jgi:hypothetical protein
MQNLSASSLVAEHSVRQGKRVVVVYIRDNYLLGLFEGVHISKLTQFVGLSFHNAPQFHMGITLPYFINEYIGRILV